MNVNPSMDQHPNVLAVGRVEAEYFQALIVACVTGARWGRGGGSRILGSLSIDDGDGNENGKKAIGSDWQNNNFARASRVFVHFFAVVARLRRETS